MDISVYNVGSRFVHETDILEIATGRKHDTRACREGEQEGEREGERRDAKGRGRGRKSDEGGGEGRAKDRGKDYREEQ